VITNPMQHSPSLRPTMLALINRPDTLAMLIIKEKQPSKYPYRFIEIYIITTIKIGMKYSTPNLATHGFIYNKNFND
jgi:hypothetical protein